MGSTKEHQELCDKILFAVGSLPNVRLWPRVVGVGRALNNYNHVVSYGIPGESDLDGIIGPNGRKLSIEIKTGKSQLRSEQKKWKAMIEKFGGVHIVARSVEQCLADLEKHL
jgi:hypothetical protein